MKRNIAAIGAALICLTCIQTVQGQTTTLRYGQIPSTIKTVSALQFYIAQRKGFFARERVGLEMISIEGGAANMMAALDRGTVDITRTATFFLIQAALKGSEGVAIVGETATPIYSLMVKPEIKTFADLKGKVVGLTNAVSTISVSMRKLLALHSLQASDYRVIEFVGTPERSECLKKGQCDAVPLGQPEDFILLKQGYRRLGVSNDAVPNFQFTVSVVRRSWGEANKDALVRYVQGLASAFRFMRDPETRDELIKTIVDTTGSSEEIARQTVSLYFEPDRGVVPKQGELDLKGLGQVIQFMSETGDLRPPLPSPERFVDLQYLRAAGIQ
jgi:ABC-type nitrate/sulfonate/bicarbonate transport system substrate-binding protein